VFVDQVRFGRRGRDRADDVGRLGAGGPAQPGGEFFAEADRVVLRRRFGVEVDQQGVADPPAFERPPFGREGDRLQPRPTAVGAGDEAQRGGAVAGVEPAFLAGDDDRAADQREAEGSQRVFFDFDRLRGAGQEAAELDRAPRFPREAFFHLADAGALAAVRDGDSVRPGWDLLRRVAAADASVGRILDGHQNAVERLEVAAAEETRERELAAVLAGQRILRVRGADPGPGEGEPARLHETGGGLVLRGAKTFCSGAGGVDAALVMVGDDDRAPSLVLIECGERVEVDRDWYRAAGLCASESHRVVFADAPVSGVLGEPGELARDPWFSRDAMRTAAMWAGMVDAAAEAALEDLAERRPADPLAALAAGRIEAMHATVADANSTTLVALWATSVVEGGVRATSIAMRVEIDRAAKGVLEVAAGPAGRIPSSPGDGSTAPGATSRPSCSNTGSTAADEAGSRATDARMTDQAAHDRAPVEHFERLARESPGPWGYATNSYEQAKYRATLDHLPERPGRTLELGCSVGVFTAMLAPRCAHLVAVDFSPTALERARERLGGAENVELGTGRGKGDAMWRAAGATTAELLVFLDADTLDFDPGFLTGLVGPLLLDPSLSLVKGTFQRPLALGAEVRAGEGGRVTELVARPLLNLHFPTLAGFAQPLAGEIAIRRDLFERLSVPVGYGIEIAMLIDAVRLVGLDALAEVNLGARQNRDQSLRALSAIAAEVMVAVERRSGGAPRPASPAFRPRPEAGEEPEVWRLRCEERPPLASP
jgi:hypothetical protein